MEILLIFFKRGDIIEMLSKDSWQSVSPAEEDSPPFSRALPSLYSHMIKRKLYVEVKSNAL